jgi:phenylacetate-CoA ligase
MKKLQEQRLRAMVSHAYHNTRFWREWFDSANLRPEDIKTLDDLSKIPMCTKQDLLNKPQEDRLSEDPAKCMKMSTSGSTGGPLSVFYSKPFADYVMSVVLFRIARMMEFSRLCKIMGIAYALPSKDSKEPENPTEPSRTPASRVFGPVGRALRPMAHNLHRTVYIGYGIEDVLPEITRFGPKNVYGTPTYVRLLADAVNEQGIKEVRPKEVFLTGEPLDEPTRHYIDQTFGCRTLAGYGANEFGFLALECKEGSGMHVQSDSAIIEVIDKDGKPARPGEAGEMVITGLLNTAMPLIRYNIGDIGVMSDVPCPCGITMPILASVEGRVIDHIVLPGGRTLSPKRVMTLMHGVDGLPRMQLVQETLDVFTLRVFTDTAGGRAATAEFLRLLRLEIGEEATVNVSYETPERLRAKFRPVISRVAAVDGNRWVTKPITS